ncbi:hypothetical protein N7471_010416 [Penicillium samsonianum]|uniref:uncharacterized protein n=1 Tax=Penicillium samsonianum TaxID=1882272 RepID=UPI0025479BCC|nr:uncharacterized protein N7471_010416 [Penicillium samsonianum]KAJ6125923.1 hypothetical protein N7471_010416 [Penicillium samsonianum]
MRTRQKRLNYRVLNDESDGESLPEDQTDQSSESSEPLRNLTRTLPTCQKDAVILANIPDCELLPSESVSQVLVSQESSTDAGTSITNHVSSRWCKRPAPATEWIWEYFETTAVDCPWVIKRTNKRRLVDREICCMHVDEKTGTRCDWHTSGSQRQNTTSNMKTHLAKHDIYCPTSSIQPAKKGPDIRSFMGGKQSLTHQEVLERNAIRWIVTDMKAFTTVESPEFQQMFRDIPGIEPPFTSRHTLRDRIMQEFAIQRTNLKNELTLTCKTIALSLDIWTSQNHLPILGIIGHWLTDEFEYRERLLEFTELQGIHSGENLAIAVENMLIELSLEEKLISITGDNASNNEAMASELYFSLSDRPRMEDAMPEPLYRGLDSYIRCLAHVLNLIVEDILRNLGPGTMEQAQVACDCLQTDYGSSLFGLTEVLSADRNGRRFADSTIFPTNSLRTMLMVDDGLKSRQQVNKFLNLQEELPPFTLQDWSRLEQIHTVLHKFNELTLFISKRNPQISHAVPIYYELYELLDDVTEGNDDFAKLDRDIIAAVKEGMKKYEKYNSILDDCDTYYTALVSGPRVKSEMVLRESKMVYAASNLEHEAAASKLSFLQHSDVGSRMLKKLQARDPPLSDIDKYFDTPPISVADTTGQNWLCNWWKMRKGEYPRMAAAARDYLAIPASEVAVERVFSTARDVLGIRRYSLKADTLRMLMLIRDGYKW